VTSATSDLSRVPRRPAGAGLLRAAGRRAGTGLGVGVATLYLSLIVLIPLAAVVVRSGETGLDGFWRAVTTPETAAALVLTVGASLIVVAVNVVTGTLIAWVLVRDRFPGQRIVDTLIDMPFALPTIVAGLVLLTLYGPGSPVGIDLAYQRVGVVVALLFVTLPFVVRTVQPVLIELDREMEEAAASLGASQATIFRRIVLPNLYPAIAAGAAIAFFQSIENFNTTLFTRGTYDTLTVYVFSKVRSGITPTINALALILIAITIVGVVWYEISRRRTARRLSAIPHPQS